MIRKCNFCGGKNEFGDLGEHEICASGQTIFSNVCYIRNIFKRNITTGRRMGHQTTKEG